MDEQRMKQVLEAAIFAADAPLDRDTLLTLFDPGELDQAGLERLLQALREDYATRGLELKEVASGFRFQVQKALGPWVARLWQEKPQRYSRAILETLALIAYRQPITRGEIEEIRGVAVGTQIIKTLLERNWVRVVGHRDVPGRPALFATTRQFLDYFELTSLDQLPPLAEIRDLDQVNRELGFDTVPEDNAEDIAAASTPASPDADVAVETSGWDAEAEQADLARVDAILADFDSRFRRDKPAARSTDETTDNAAEPTVSPATTAPAVEPDDE